jgi:hypothetical protein
METPEIIQTLLGFLATLTATLIGVYIAFQKDRKADRQQTRKTTIQHLKSIKKELELNHTNAQGNYNLIDTMQQQEDFDADHYSLEPYSTDAWDSAVSDQIIEVLDADLYTDLQRTYFLIKSTNEQIRRIRMEPLHNRIGDELDYGVTKVPVWTIDVNHWDTEREEINQKGLGEIIRDKSQKIRVHSGGNITSIEDEIERIEKLDKTTGIHGFHQTAARNYQN